MNATNPKVDGYFNRAKKWQPELEKLRSIVLGCHLTEELKWGKPCYAFEKTNVLVIVGFKECCALIMFKGALLNDPSGILILPGENTQAARQIRFTSLQQINELEPVLKEYIHQAIEVEKSGLKVDYTKSTELVLAGELVAKLDEMPELKTAFEALTPGRRRAYNMHFSGAKQSSTREARVVKCMPQILDGKGLND